MDAVLARVRTLQWQRGLRALVAMGSAMVVCHALRVAPGAAALGAFDALLVDNGGPYRVRLRTMATTLVGGAAALVAGALVPGSLGVAIGVTMLVCFGLTFMRVLSQPLASSSVLVLILYFAGLGGTEHTVAGALFLAEMVLLGGVWAVAISLVLWPLDPFRPARLAVAGCYGSLAEFTAGMAGGALRMAKPEADREESQRLAHEWRHAQRVRMEAARTALGATAARAPSRTVRARNLTVLLETSDMLLARLVRLAELADLGRAAEVKDSVEIEARLGELAKWLAGSERAIGAALEHRPADGSAAFARDGSLWMEVITRRREALRGMESAGDGALSRHLQAEERDALLEMEIALDAVRAIWTGVEARRPVGVMAGEVKAGWGLGWIDAGWIDAGWRDAVEANWSLASANLRHSLRLMMVGGVDVVVMRLIHVNHGFWLPMTSIILLQPYSAGTARKSVQRVGGTVAGGILAAVFAATLTDPLVMLGVITVLAALTVATYAVDYAIYCFFLTPTFVLLSLPHAHDWRYAGVRIGTTLLGALIAIGAMRLLWPERAEAELGGLLRRGAEACAAYLRALLLYWEIPESGRRAAERELLAPARRMCGLASNDAEEAVDRVMQEPQFGRRAEQELKMRDAALTYATYLRRLTQSTTTMALVGRDSEAARARILRVVARLDGVAEGPAGVGGVLPELAEEQMQRIERQAGVLERAAGVFRVG